MPWTKRKCYMWVWWLLFNVITAVQRSMQLSISQIIPLCFLVMYLFIFSSLGLTALCPCGRSHFLLSYRLGCMIRIDWSIKWEHILCVCVSLCVCVHLYMCIGRTHIQKDVWSGFSRRGRTCSRPCATEVSEVFLGCGLANEISYSVFSALLVLENFYSNIILLSIVHNEVDNTRQMNLLLQLLVHIGTSLTLGWKIAFLREKCIFPHIKKSITAVI